MKMTNLEKTLRAMDAAHRAGYDPSVEEMRELIQEAYERDFPIRARLAKLIKFITCRN